MSFMSLGGSEPSVCSQTENASNSVGLALLVTLSSVIPPGGHGLMTASARVLCPAQGDGQLGLLPPEMGEAGSVPAQTAATPGLSTRLALGPGASDSVGQKPDLRF